MFEKIVYLALAASALFTLIAIGVFLYSFLSFWPSFIILAALVLGTLISLASVIASGQNTRIEEAACDLTAYN